MGQMAQMKRPHLKKFEALADHTLRLTFIDDSVYTVNFEGLFIESPGLAPLKNPAVFSQATLVPGEGWTYVQASCAALYCVGLQGMGSRTRPIVTEMASKTVNSRPTLPSRWLRTQRYQVRFHHLPAAAGLFSPKSRDLEALV